VSNNRFFFNKNRIEAEYDFKYIFYEKNETLTTDNEIRNINSDEDVTFLENSTKKYVEINLEIENTNIVTEDSFENIDIQFYRSINNISLSESQLNKFIDVNNLENKYIYVNEDIDLNKVKNSFDFFGIDSNQYSSSLDIISTSKNTYIDSRYSNEIKVIKRKNIFSNERILENITNSKKVLKNNVSLNSISRDLTLGFEKEENTSSYVYSEETNITKKERLFVGILVKKFEKASNINLLDSRFYFNESFNDPSYRKVIRDDAVKYGKTYIYVVYPVYHTNLVLNKNLPYKNNYLVCGMPSVSEDIVCKEFLRPPPPSGIYGEYNKNTKSFRITWELPVNDQEDIKGFQIFKRDSIKDPYNLVVQLESHDKNDLYERNENVQEEKIIKKQNVIFFEYEDKNFDTSKLNIYTICSIDAHGLVSNYSDQIGFLYDFLQNKTISDLISSSGAPLFYPNLMIPRKTIFVDNDEKINTITPIVKNKRKFTLIAAPDFFEYNDINNSGNIKNLYKTGENDYYKFIMFRANNRSLKIDKIKISE